MFRKNINPKLSFLHFLAVLHIYVFKMQHNISRRKLFISDEDRLSRRKSIVDTVSLQVDILSNSVPSDDVVSCWNLMMENCLKVAII